jgi:hypothetical protein
MMTMQRRVKQLQEKSSVGVGEKKNPRAMSLKPSRSSATSKMNMVW